MSDQPSSTAQFQAGATVHFGHHLICVCPQYHLNRRLGQDWFTLSKDIRHLDVGTLIVSQSAAALFNASYKTGGIFLKTWDIATDEDFIANCVGACSCPLE
jgi:hypothetical protein